jgi:hypothetical protein
MSQPVKNTPVAPSPDELIDGFGARSVKLPIAKPRGEPRRKVSRPDKSGRFSTTVPSKSRRSRLPRFLAWAALLICVATSAFLIGTVVADESSVSEPVK